MIPQLETMYKKTKLFSVGDDHKTIKGEKYGYKTYILYLSPFTDNSKGINLCPHASVGCSTACLFKSGMAGLYVHVANGRRNKTEWYLENRKEFMHAIEKEIRLAINRHEGYKVVFRLNGTSDIRWEKIPIAGRKNIFEMFPEVQFYDYTKNPLRMNLGIPNYHITFSRSENNHDIAMKVLKTGHNVAMVFRYVPDTFEGYKVINGDDSDVRFNDPKGVIVGLKYKNATGAGGKAANANSKVSGFVI